MVYTNIFIIFTFICSRSSIFPHLCPSLLTFMPLSAHLSQAGLGWMEHQKEKEQIRGMWVINIKSASAEREIQMVVVKEDYWNYWCDCRNRKLNSERTKATFREMLKTYWIHKTESPEPCHLCCIRKHNLMSILNSWTGASLFNLDYHHWRPVTNALRVEDRRQEVTYSVWPGAACII